jgi:hypothetical protein
MLSLTYFLPTGFSTRGYVGWTAWIHAAFLDGNTLQFVRSSQTHPVRSPAKMGTAVWVWTMGASSLIMSTGRQGNRRHDGKAIGFIAPMSRTQYSKCPGSGFQAIHKLNRQAMPPL